MSNDKPGTIPGYPNLKPFARGGDPRRNVGGKSNKVLALRRKLGEFDEEAMATLKEMFASGDWPLRQEALRFWGKYRLPVPTVADSEDELLSGCDDTATKLLEGMTPEQVFAIASGRDDGDKEH